MDPKQVSEKLFPLILESVADGVFAVDENFRIIFMNHAAEEITGFARQEALGRNCYEVFRASICAHECAVRETLSTGRPMRDVRVDILNRDNDEVPISVSTAVLRDEEGSLLGAVEVFRDLSALEALRREVQDRYVFQDLVGRGRAMQEIFRLLPTMAASDATVLIQGPSGTGKELVARALHELSARKDERYERVNCGALPPELLESELFKEERYERVNCGALPPELLESELFGHMRGAFTDAKQDKPGRFLLASGGTMLLDEVGELPLTLQVKLLRALQEKEIQPLGSTKTIKVNTRVVAATNKNLREETAAGRFREDLYFRLRVLLVEIPPLRERREDILPLVDHILRRVSLRSGKTIEKLSPEVIERLHRHDFPGNVRELENILEHASVVAQGRTIELRHLPPDLMDPAIGRDPGASSGEGLSPLESAEADAVRRALVGAEGNRAEAALSLGISRTTLWRKMRRLGIERD